MVGFCCANEYSVIVEIQDVFLLDIIYSATLQVIQIHLVLADYYVRYVRLLAISNPVEGCTDICFIQSVRYRLSFGAVLTRAANGST